MAKKKNLILNSEISCSEEVVEEVCFTDYVEPPEGSISLFNFADEESKKSSSGKTEIKNTPIYDNRKSPIANGVLPPIDGEAFNFRRTYLLRESTIRKLNELKAAHYDINIYVSAIVDAAICNHHKLIIEEGGTQK